MFYIAVYGPYATWNVQTHLKSTVLHECMCRCFMLTPIANVLVATENKEGTERKGGGEEGGKEGRGEIERRKEEKVEGGRDQGSKDKRKAGEGKK